MKKAGWWILMAVLGVLGVYLQYNLYLTAFNRASGAEVPKVVLWQIQAFGPTSAGLLFVWGFPKMLMLIAAGIFWWRLYRNRGRSRKG